MGYLVFLVLAWVISFGASFLHKLNSELQLIIVLPKWVGYFFLIRFHGTPCYLAGLILMIATYLSGCIILLHYLGVFLFVNSIIVWVVTFAIIAVVVLGMIEIILRYRKRHIS